MRVSIYLIEAIKLLCAVLRGLFYSVLVLFFLLIYCGGLLGVGAGAIATVILFDTPTTLQFVCAGAIGGINVGAVGVWMMSYEPEPW